MSNTLNYDRHQSRPINEDFDFTGMSDTDYTDTFADMDDTMILVKEWCDAHISFGKPADYDVNKMTTYSGRYYIDPSSYMISLLFDERTPANNRPSYIFGNSSLYRTGRFARIVDDATNPESYGSNKWTGGDFPDYIRFDVCDGDFIVTNHDWYACPPMTFRGFPVTITGMLFVNVGLKNPKWFNDNQTVVDGWSGLPARLDLSGLPTKTCGGLSFTNCGLTSIKGMPALKSDSANSVKNVVIDFEDNRLRNLDGINLSGNPVISNFIVSNNMLESLAGSPNRITGRCDVSDNCLTSLVGMPKYIGGDFNCYGNFLKKSTVISRLSDVKGTKWGLNRQKKNPVKSRSTVNEGFDFSNMSDTDYTDTFADADDNAIGERIADIKKWATYNIFSIDWNVMSESTRNFIDDAVRVTAEPDGYHMSVVLPDSEYAYNLGMRGIEMNLYKSVRFGEDGIPYMIPEGSTTGIYPGLKLDRFDCSEYGKPDLSIRVDAKTFKWSDLTPCFRELDSVRSLEIGSTTTYKLKINSLDGFPAIKGSDEFTFRLSSIIYKDITNPPEFPVFFDDVIKNIKLRDTDPDAPSSVNILVDYGILSPFSPAEIYDGNYAYTSYLRWNGCPNYIRYMTWDAFREYVERFIAKSSTRAAMIHLINGWKEKSDIGVVFTVNDSDCLHSDTPWATCIVHANGAYYVMNPKILERMTDGR